MHARTVSLVVALALAPGCATVIRPRADLAPASVTSFSYEDLDRVLDEHVDEDGLVDYAALKAEPEHLERFYALVAAVSPKSHPELFPRPEDALAYWINAYNAAVLELVVHLYPIESVRDASRPFFLPKLAGFFYVRCPVFGGESKNLRALENDLIRVEFPDPRTHFALNCASRGCPRLPRKAFDPDELDAELDREARRFFAEERNLRIDHERRTVVLSQILEWYEEDFLRSGKATLLEVAAAYAPEATARELETTAKDYTVEFVPYDWTLNDRAFFVESSL